jgi:hypothetical protein
MNIEERLKYYLGEFYDKEIIIDKEELINNNELIDKKVFLMNLEEFNPKNKKMIKLRLTDEVSFYLYFEHMRKLLKETKIHNNILFLTGDYNNNPTNLPLLCKTRRENNNNIIINVTRYRHMNLVDYLYKNPDIPFDIKKNIILWRGSTTGKRSKPANRYSIVEKYYNKNNIGIDIGFCQNKVINNCETVGITRNNIDNKYIKEALDITKQLQYKFLVSVEGNEVASGLKWMLYSNSVVLMAKPRNFSWIMEDKLIPNIHYILLEDDFSDLEEKYKWCKNNLDKCKKISENATQYMKQFLDIGKEREIEKEVIRRYAKNVIIK